MFEALSRAVFDPSASSLPAEEAKSFLGYAQPLLVRPDPQTSAMLMRVAGGIRDYLASIYQGHGPKPMPLRLPVSQLDGSVLIPGSKVSMVLSPWADSGDGRYIRVLGSSNCGDDSYGMLTRDFNRANLGSPGSTFTEDGRPVSYFQAFLSADALEQSVHGAAEFLLKRMVDQHDDGLRYLSLINHHPYGRLIDPMAIAVPWRRPSGSQGTQQFLAALSQAWSTVLSLGGLSPHEAAARVTQKPGEVLLGFPIPYHGDIHETALSAAPIPAMSYRQLTDSAGATHGAGVALTAHLPHTIVGEQTARDACASLNRHTRGAGLLPLTTRWVNGTWTYRALGEGLSGYRLQFTCILLDDYEAHLDLVRELTGVLREVFFALNSMVSAGRN